MEFGVSLVYNIVSARTIGRYIMEPCLRNRPTNWPTKTEWSGVAEHTVIPSTLVAKASLSHTVSSRPVRATK